MPYNPLRFTFAYLLKEYRSLIDTGLESEGAQATLNEQLRIAGVKPQDIKNIILTHIHRDHAGLISYLTSVSDTRVYVHEAVEKALENINRRNISTVVRRELKMFGAERFLSLMIPPRRFSAQFSTGRSSSVKTKRECFWTVFDTCGPRLRR